jgi:predicted lipid-binding transport protein (Tim44 family)
MFRHLFIPTAVAAGVLVSGCATAPLGPTVAAMPPPGKQFELFAHDDYVCRQWAGATVGPNRDQATNQMLGSMLAGLAIGAAAGALADGHDGAGTGAAIGTVLGTGAGYSQSEMTGWAAQRSYDVAYQQCMYAKGNVIPGYYPYPAHATAPPQPQPQPHPQPQTQPLPPRRY